MIESNQAQLRRRYPTMELFNIALNAAGSKVALGREIGMSAAPLSFHHKQLKRRLPLLSVDLVPRHNNCDLKDGELDARIKAMFGRKYEDVKVYKLSPDYVSGQLTMGDADYIRTDVSPTSLSLWGRGVWGQRGAQSPPYVDKEAGVK